MTGLEEQLFRLLKDRSFRCDGPYRLASGETSDYYIDGKASAVYSEAAWLIGENIYERTKALEIDAIGGLEVGAVPLSTATVISYHLHGQKMEGFWVRDEVKKHGTQKLIEGNLKPGTRVVVLDDVFTKGTSTLKAVNAVKAIGCKVVMVLAIVDRLRGAQELFQREGIDNFQSLFTIRDFGVAVDASKTTEAVSV